MDTACNMHCAIDLYVYCIFEGQLRTPIGIYIADTHLSEATIDINRKIFSQVFQLAESMGTNTIIHAGDIFTSRKGQTQDVLLAFKEILDAAAKRNIKIIAIPGNHDKTNTTVEPSFLHVFDGHPAFTVLGTGSKLENESVDIFFLPYYDEALAYPGQLAKVVKEVDPKKVNILVTHVGVDKATTNGGIAIESNITRRMFKPFNHVLIGHYHDRQEWGYTGSAYQANFGEDEHKGCVVIYDDPTDPLEFIELDFPKYVTVDILPQDLTRELVTLVTKKQTEAHVRLKIAGVLTEESKPLLVELQGIGAKVVIDKQDFVPIDALQTQDVTISNKDILSTFDKWVEERQIKGAKFGKQILQKAI